jgi:hypothetical protein
MTPVLDLSWKIFFLAVSLYGYVWAFVRMHIETRIHPVRGLRWLPVVIMIGIVAGNAITAVGRAWNAYLGGRG